jgi:hypothetical protein
VSLPAVEQAPPAGGPVDRPGESGESVDSVEEGTEPDGEAGALHD